MQRRSFECDSPSWPRARNQIGFCFKGRIAQKIDGMGLGQFNLKHVHFLVSPPVRFQIIFSDSAQGGESLQRGNGTLFNLNYWAKIRTTLKKKL